MNELRLDLKPLQFDQLVELGRSLIPSLAPGWTDHNVHDPGIMIVELLAWIAEAQMYSLARLRKDEREAYAQLLGIELRGPLPARGLVWPSPSAALPPRYPIAKGTALKDDRVNPTTFRTSADLQLTTANLTRVESTVQGVRRDWTVVNAREGAVFHPYGVSPAADDTLMLTLAAAKGAEPSGTAPISVGFEIENPNAAPGLWERPLSPLQVLVKDVNGLRPVDVVNDGTDSFLHSGAVLLELDSVTQQKDQTFQLLFPAPIRGFIRTPAMRSIALNVLPVEQIRGEHEKEPHFGTGVPDAQYRLTGSGLMFTANEHPLEVRIGSSVWTETDDLIASQPADQHYELDASTGTITFGNGVNGSCVPDDNTSLEVFYSASDGAAGNVPPGVNWTLATVAGAFGQNKEPMAGGTAATGLDDLRTAARLRFATDRPYITRDDVEKAAQSFLDLGVTRAVELAARGAQPRLKGNRVLVTAGSASPDSQAFLDTIASRISPRLPLGQRMNVIGPRYVKLRVSATLAAATGVSAPQLATAALDELETRLATVAEAATLQWPLGRGVSSTTVSGWLRRLDGVVKVTSVALFSGNSTQSAPAIQLKPDELPAFDRSASQVTVTGRGGGSAS